MKCRLVGSSENDHIRRDIAFGFRPVDVPSMMTQSRRDGFQTSLSPVNQ
jgi:hypothetical protein